MSNIYYGVRTLPDCKSVMKAGKQRVTLKAKTFSPIHSRMYVLDDDGKVLGTMYTKARFVSRLILHTIALQIVDEGLERKSKNLTRIGVAPGLIMQLYHHSNPIYKWHSSIGGLIAEARFKLLKTGKPEFYIRFCGRKKPYRLYKKGNTWMLDQHKLKSDLSKSTTLSKDLLRLRLGNVNIVPMGMFQNDSYRVQLLKRVPPPEVVTLALYCVRSLVTLSLFNISMIMGSIGNVMDPQMESP